MESLYKRRVYQSMRKKKAAASKKRPQIGLSARLLDDSDEESCASTTSCSSGSEYEAEESTGTERTPDSEEEEDQSSSGGGGGGGDGSESSGKGKHTRVTQPPRRKRPAPPRDPSSSSSSDSDSDVGSKPRRKVGPRKRIKVQSPGSDSEDAEEDLSPKKEKRVKAKEAKEKETKEAKEAKEKETKEAIAKRKQRQNKLLALSKKMKSRVANRRCRRKESGEEDDDEEEGKEGSKEEAGAGSDKESAKDKADDGDDDDGGDDDGVDDGPATDQFPSSQEELKDTDSMNDFIVEDEDKGDTNEEELDPQQKALLSLPREFITGSQLTHFQVVVKALLINVLDETFLKSLYSGERTKRYAQEMKTSLFHFDERTVLPRLENLKQRSRWTSRYKERVECYPKVRLVNIGLHKNVCEACQLQRQCSFTVKLSGQLYDSNTLQEDHFMPNDTQAFSVGSVCASRTEVYHILKHFKYHLFQHCRTVLEEEKQSGAEEEAVKDTVNRVFVKLQDGGWISEQYEKFQDHLNNADYFQEEKLD